MNGVEMPQTINESNKAPYLDRYRSQEAIDPQSGSLSINVSDLVLPGRDGLDFALTRHYNSNQAQMGEMKASFTDAGTNGNYYKDVYYWYYILVWYSSTGSGPNQEFGSNYRTIEEAQAACLANASNYADYSCRLLETNGANYIDPVTHTYTQARYVTYRKNFNVASIAEKTSYQRERFDLGAGWSLGIPSVQIKKAEPDNGNEIHFHDGTGAAYRVYFTAFLDDSNLEGYPREDVKFDLDSGTYSNGEKTSVYVFITNDKRKTYFADDGRVLGIVDRFGNEIKFTHINRSVNGSSYPYLSQITDSIGRIIQFVYDNAIDNPTFAGDNVTVSVTHPDELGKQLTVKYTKMRHMVDGRYEPYLYSASMSPGTSEETITYYQYDTKEQPFSFYGNSASVYTQLLTGIVYPHSVSRYEYESSHRLMGSGWMDAFRIKERYDLNRTGSGLPSISKSNLALQKSVQVSSFAADYDSDNDTYTYYNGLNVVDGDTGTFWRPSSAQNEWLHVDLGSIQSFNQILIRWRMGTEFATTQYTIQISNDANNWTDLVAIQKSNGIADYSNSLNATARYVRILFQSIQHEMTELEINNFGGKNQVGYYYSGDYTYYPNSNLGAYKSAAINQSNLQTATSFNADRQINKVETIASNFERKTMLHQTFHPIFKYKPTRSEYRDMVGHVANDQYVDRTYTNWGGLESNTQPLGYYDINNTAVKADYTTTYQYHPSYHDLLQSQWKQNANTTLTESFEYYFDYTNPVLLGRLKKSTNANGESVDYSYELTDGKVSKTIATRTLENGKTARTETVYGPAGSYAFPTHITQFYTDDNNQPQTMQTSRTYSMLTGLLQSETAPGGRVTTYRYDALGRPVSVKQPPVTGLNGATYEMEAKTEYAPNQISSGFDATNANVQTMKVKTYTSVLNLSTNGVTVYDVREAFYDGFGNPLYQQRYDDQRGQWIAEAQYHYDAMSRPIYVADAQQNVQTIGYDAWGQIGQVTDPYGNVYKAVRDLLARKETSYMVTPDQIGSADDNVKWNVLEKQYDPLGRVTSSTVYPSWPDRNNKVQASYTYDYVGNTVMTTDPKNQVTSYQYDKLNRLVKLIDPLSQATDYTYTALGQLKDTKQYDAGQTYTTAKAYDELGRVKQNVDAAGQADLLTYNTVGDLSQKRDLKQQS
ncbi:discoidin domain-containing protein, partial [Paenibacillus hemerocallicola]